ncbi:hypothetical protein [Trichloromonas sp.]|uniref:hypothetical protein n=1 Tax=Trichloromonas sp. TaxID=3069249 RepID=UPI002A4D845B|nr:hypothetical protein [Trichloromonas sp.]
MKNIKTYKLFIEGYEEIMKDMDSSVDIKQIENAEKEIQKLKDNIEQKNEELKIKLQQLEDFQVDTLTDDNVEKIDNKKKEIEETIEKIKDDIEKHKETIEVFKKKIEDLKSNE